MKINVKVAEGSGDKKLFCPECGAPITAIWVKPGSHVSGITTKCKSCGKILEIEIS